MAEMMWIDGKTYNVNSELVADLELQVVKTKSPTAEKLLEKYKDLQDNEKFFVELIYKEIPIEKFRHTGVTSRADLAIALGLYLLKMQRKNKLFKEQEKRKDGKRKAVQVRG